MCRVKHSGIGIMGRFRIIRASWKTILVLATWLSILYFAKDVYELPDALKAWRPLVPARETALAAFSGILVLWIVWTDVRPFVHKYFASRERHPISVHPAIYCESYLLKSREAEARSPPEFWENVYYLIVQNAEPRGRTLRNVSSYLFFVGPPERCTLKDTDTFATDIRHGEVAFFRLGRVVSTEMSGRPFASRPPVSAEEMRVYRHNVPRGFLAFEPRPGAPRYGGGLGATVGTVWTFQVIISADDLPAKTIAVTFDLRSLQVTASIRTDDVAPSATR
jgi:hypothetical protein